MQAQRGEEIAADAGGRSADGVLVCRLGHFRYCLGRAWMELLGVTRTTASVGARLDEQMSSKGLVKGMQDEG